MPSKVLKKFGSKRKQNGKKTTRSQKYEVKQKYEMESSPKEQMSELEKEIFSIKINEFENKLNRKKQLCGYLKEEIKIYKTLYNEKQLLKSESMKLLNNAFEDFATEIFLLDQELNALQHNCDRILTDQEFCASEAEQVKKLYVLEENLGCDLAEAETYIQEIDSLNLKLLNLQQKAALKENVFIGEKGSLNMKFEKKLKRILEGVYSSMNKIIEDKSLKLNLLPEVYQVLFLNGLCCGSWLETALKYCDCIHLLNIDLIKLCNELYFTEKSLQRKLKEYFSDKVVTSSLKDSTIYKSKERNKILAEMKELKESEVFICAEINRELLHFKEMSIHQEAKIERMQSDSRELENAIKLLEVSGETHFETSYLVKIIRRAGLILKEEL